jgi:hypothetical protein
VVEGHGVPDAARISVVLHEEEAIARQATAETITVA